MKGLTRVVLIEPLDESRETLRNLLESIGAIRLAEMCATYDQAIEVAERIRPDLVILGLDRDPEVSLGLIPELAKTSSQPAILPASGSRDGELILRVIRAGAREFLALPTGSEELAGLVSRLMRDRVGRGEDAAGDDSKMLAVIGPAGGVGCTTLAVNIATTLAKDPSREVALVDFDLLTGAIDVCLDVIPEQSLVDVARSVGRLDPTLLTRSLTRHTSGLYVLPGPPTLDEAARIDPESLRPVLEMLRDVFPRIVVDLSKGLQTSDVIAMEMADMILMVVHLEPACLRNGARLLGLLNQFDGMSEKVRIVANHVGSTTCEVSVKKAEELLKVPIGFQIIHDPKVFAAARSRGVSLETDAAGCRAHRSIVEIARSFDPAAGAEKNRSRLGRIAASLF